MLYDNATNKIYSSMIAASEIWRRYSDRTVETHFSFRHQCRNMYEQSVSSYETSVQVSLFKRHHIPEDKIFIFNAVRISYLICLTSSLLIQSVQATDQVEYIHIQHGVASPRTEVGRSMCIYNCKDEGDRISI